ncbi:DUF167 domain-containing protein [Parerythrobacter aestuarii]|uniref:DUF167 domain-containing protein n=1 Tax=Parerythrobacter aestuarii TaxID=3020909 RepID=UPI0024DE1FB5|nr:DUF167 domain-containing protein [Parerythrobacter aestuarii]
MARPKTDLPPPEAVRVLLDGQGRIAVRVTPGARSEVVTIEAGRLLVRTRAQPEDGKANDAVLKLLARALGCAPSQLELLRGASARDKLFRLAG